MKRLYATPTLTANGSTVRETLVAVEPIGLESQFKRETSAGSLGFYL